MPTVIPEPEAEPEHRDNVSKYAPVSEEEVYELMAMVARPVGHKELKANPKAQASLDVEWDKLMKKKAWDMGKAFPTKPRRKARRFMWGRCLRFVLRRGASCLRVIH